MFQLSGNSRSNCGIVAGVPEQSLQDCLLGDITDGGCGAFLYEECQYHGQVSLSFPIQVSYTLKGKIKKKSNHFGVWPHQKYFYMFLHMYIPPPSLPLNNVHYTELKVLPP